jgi:alkylhydroperoxidase family enzyme
VTLVHDGYVPGEVRSAARARFDDAQVAHLLWAIALINAYNRLAIASRTA